MKLQKYKRYLVTKHQVNEENFTLISGICCLHILQFQNHSHWQRQQISPPPCLYANLYIDRKLILCLNFFNFNFFSYILYLLPLSIMLPCSTKKLHIYFFEISAFQASTFFNLKIKNLCLSHVNQDRRKRSQFILVPINLT